MTEFTKSLLGGSGGLISLLHQECSTTMAKAQHLRLFVILLMSLIFIIIVLIMVAQGLRLWEPPEVEYHGRPQLFQKLRYAKRMPLHSTYSKDFRV